jgi:hypothetical protein
MANNGINDVYFPENQDYEVGVAFMKQGLKKG